MLFDTDVLIRVLHKSTKAAKEIDKDDNRFISAVNYMELMQRARNKREPTFWCSLLPVKTLSHCAARIKYFSATSLPSMPRQLSPKTVTHYDSFFRLHSMAPQTVNAVPNAPAPPSTHYPLTCNSFSGKFFSPFTIAKRIFTLEEDITVLKNKCHSKSFQW